jgi:hypothetical protein
MTGSLSSPPLSRIWLIQSRAIYLAEGVASRHLKRHPDDAAALKASQAAVEQLAEFAVASLDRSAT